MKHFFQNLMSHWKLVILPALLKMGFWGVGLSALIDSASLPIPMDPLMAVYIWNDKTHFWLYCLMGAAGSAIGGLVPYALGRAGGELFLLKRIDRAKFERIRQRFEKQEFLAMLVPSMLPPPTPWKAFVFAAGVFEMRIPLFMLAVFIGRTIRWLILSALIIKLGPGAIHIANTAISHHIMTVLFVLLDIIAVIAGWFWLKRRARRNNRSEDIL